jgi:non-heme chloroperoxidase
MKPLCEGNDMETYAKDLTELIEALNLRNVVLTGHSTGGGEVVKCAVGPAKDRVSKVITAGAVPPMMVKSESNPEGTPIEVFDGQRQALLKDRSQFCKDPSEPFYGANREGRRCRKAPRMTSGVKACSSTLPPHTTASRPSPRRTKPRT